MVNQDNEIINLSTVNTLQVEVRKPTGQCTTYAASIKNSPGSDGYLRYQNTGISIFTVVGDWKYRGRLIYTDGTNLKGSWIEFECIS